MGVVVAAAVLALWLSSLVLSLERGAAGMSLVAIVLTVALRTHLSVGLFITAHDAMHGTVSRSRRINDLVGAVAAFLFGAMSYPRLVRNHALHHAHPATDRDPDYCAGSARFVPWFLRFMARYATALQVLTMAALYNVLRLRYDDATLWLFWAGPALLASLQLFTFGTYLPHRPPHAAALGPHRARTLDANHAWAMLTCWFFGYHREHHEGPHVPWWQLHRTKRARALSP